MDAYTQKEVAAKVRILVAASRLGRDGGVVTREADFSILLGSGARQDPPDSLRESLPASALRGAGFRGQGRA